MASRIAAKSTSAGTPVKSCIRTRAGRNAISQFALPVIEPTNDGFDIRAADRAAILVPEQVFKNNLQGHRQSACSAQSLTLGMRNGRNAVASIANAKNLLRAEAV